MTYNLPPQEGDGVGMMPDSRFQVHPSSTVFHGKHHQGFGFPIDPVLESNTYSDQRPELHGISGMQRYLREPQARFFDAPPPYTMANATFSPIYPGMVSSVPPGPHFRSGSPVSYQHSLPTSGARSPPLTDNDPYVDSTQGPSTPPDAAIISPQIAPWDSQSPRITLTGLSNMPQGCVNPAAVINERDGFGELSLDETVGSDSITPTALYHGNTPSPFSMDTPSSGADAQSHPTRTYHELRDIDVDEKLADEGSIDSVSTAAEDDQEYKPSNRGKASRPRTSRGASRRGRRSKRSGSTTLSESKVSKTSPQSRASTGNSKNRKLPSGTAAGTKVCSHCDSRFPDDASLQKHVTSSHKRPFTCVFHFAGCDKVFANKNEWKRHTWDNRMEHVAIHLEHAANNEEPPVSFGGAGDEALVEWASSPSVTVIERTFQGSILGWKTCQTIKAARVELSNVTTLEEDAEGEEYY
ncbi:hypothetical protein ACJZ2D_007789 [Fusarium nematophilum]